MLQIKSAYTARELAELKLAMLPSTERGVQKLAARKKWNAIQNPNAKGVVYPLGTLPAEVRKAILDKDTKGAAALVNPLAGLEEVSAGIKAEDRLTAKLTIVAMYRQFQKFMGLKRIEAEMPFLTHYREQAVKHPKDMPYNVYADFSVQSLRRWKVMADANPKALAGNYSGRKGTGSLHRAAGGSVGDYIAALLCENRHFKAGHIRDLCRDRFGEVLEVNGKQVPLPSLRQFERHIAEWKQENASLFMAITAPGEFKSKVRVATGDASAHVEGLNQEWQIDASPADALCVDGRYNIYAIIDIWSRRALFLVSKTAKTEASLLLVRRAIMEWGMPDTIKTDNGADFTSYRFKHALLSLGIHQEISPPFSPEKKPFVERVIGTMQRDLMTILPGFGGHNVADRQRIREQKDFANRLGEGQDKAFSVQLTAEELQKAMNEWAAGKYGNRVHSSLGLSPNDKAATWAKAVKKPKDIRALDLLLAPIAVGNGGYRTITKQGIAVDGYHYISEELVQYIGKTVFVRHDPADKGRIYAFDEDGEFMGEGTNPELSGIDPVAFAAAAKAAQAAFIAEGKKAITKERRKMDRQAQAEAILALHPEQKVAALPRQAEEHLTPALEAAGRAVNKTEIAPRTEDENRKMQELAERMKQQAEAPKPLTDKERWAARADEIEERLVAGKPVSSVEKEWWDNMQIQSWYKAHKNDVARRREADEAARIAVETIAAQQKETPSVGLDVSNSN